MKERAQYWCAAVRVGLGWVFLWAFLDKLLGLGFSTRPEQAWLAGGSPTAGYLANASAGPLSGLYRATAGAAWVDWLFMLGLLGLGVALLLGVAVRLAGYAGALLMLMMWSSRLPPAQNPIIDEHIIYALTLLALAASRAGDTWGLGRWWAERVMHRVAGRDFRLLGELLVAAFMALQERVALTVVDAGRIMEGDGPTFGSGRWLGKLLAGPTIEVEWLCAHLLGAERTPVPQALQQWGLEPPLGSLVRPGALGPIGVRAPSTYARSLWGRLPAWTNVDYRASVILARVFISRAWSHVRIDRSRCTSCRTCVTHCPVGAISDELVIDDELCARCLSCVENCPQQAIRAEFGWLMRLLNRVGGYVY